MSETSSEISRLNSVRHALLRLHKTLLDGEKARYEREHGRIESSAKLLELVVGDPEFDWLRRVSELIVQIDQAMEDKDEPLLQDGAKALAERVRALLTPAETGDVFARNYHDALLKDPAVGVVHGEIRSLLKSR